jgi:hypothetical protein
MNGGNKKDTRGRIRKNELQQILHLYNVAQRQPEDVRTERRDLIKANKAGLLGKDVWKNYTETMLRYRAIGDCIKFFAPEAMSGVSMYEEVRDYSVENSDYQVVEPKGKVRSCRFELLTATLWIDLQTLLMLAHPMRLKPLKRRNRKK